MTRFNWVNSLRNSYQSTRANHGRRGKPIQMRSRIGIEILEDRTVPAGINPNELIDISLTPDQLAATLTGPGVTISNVSFTGNAASAGSFSFNDPTVVGFSQGIVLSSGSVVDVVGPNLFDDITTFFDLPGDPDLDALSGFTTFDASVLEFDFIPSGNQVVFSYAFASDEYPEWVNSPFNDVFAFYVNGTNYATVRQVAGDPTSPFVPVAVNNINNGNPRDPDFIPTRPDLFRANYFDPNGGPSLIDLEMDGITRVLTFQAPVNPGVVNHMKLAIADASDGVLDSAVFIRADSFVSNENPVADLSLTPESGPAALFVTAYIEGEDPNGLPLTWTINWGDGTVTTGPLDQPPDENEKTATTNHTYTMGGSYTVTLTVTNGTLFGTSTEDVEVYATGNQAPVVTNHPEDVVTVDHSLFSFSASATGTPIPTVQWQISTDAGATFTYIPGATDTTYSATASLADNGNLYRAVFTNSEGSVTTNAAALTVAPSAPIVNLVDDSGFSSTDKLTNLGTLNVTGIAPGAIVEFSTNDGTSWNTSFTAVEGSNTLLVRQTVAGQVSEATHFSFMLDTTLPTLNPTFSQTSPFLVNATGITVSGNATDQSGIFWSTNGVVNTSSPGLKYVTCTATDNAGNTAAVEVPYVVGYGIINLLPLNGDTFR
ncbi:MAG: choice-of-anchor L domain-containing protein [Planctomycetia bacterium]|nr:choice-of-anchor L domain-containing protein [Planctomycetia bacterium]